MGSHMMIEDVDEEMMAITMIDTMIAITQKKIIDLVGVIRDVMMGMMKRRMMHRMVMMVMDGEEEMMITTMIDPWIKSICACVYLALCE
jgi:hypothetical protein